MLVGSWIGFVWGFEGNVQLDKNKPADNILVLNKSIFYVQNILTGATYHVPFDPSVNQPSDKNRRVLGIPDTRLRVVAHGYDSEMQITDRLVADPMGAGAPGVELSMKSGMMAQSVPVILQEPPSARSEFDFFGRAKIRFVESFELESEKKLEEAVEYRETRMVFMKQPEIPVVHHSLGDGERSGFEFYLEERLSEKKNGADVKPGKRKLGAEADGGMGLRMVKPDGSERWLGIMENLDKPFFDEGTRTHIHVAGYWPDFVMIDGKPETRGESPENPALLVTLSGVVDVAAKTGLELLIDRVGEGRFSGKMLRDGVEQKRFDIAGEGEVEVGWADWKLSMKQFLGSSLIVEDALPSGKRSVVMEEGKTPGVLLMLGSPAGGESASKWVPSGTSELFSVGDEHYRIGFGMRPHPMPFAIGLDGFEVPRDEGTMQPSNFISRVYFQEGGKRTHEALIQMNEPASYPASFWMSLAGMNYKFSQAGWDAENLDTTVLQVLYDPGWLLKWIGSLMICGGVFTLFYLQKPAAVKSLPGTGGEARSPSPESGP